FTQSILYGLYIPTFAGCLRWLMFENEGWKLRPCKQMTWSYIIIAILVFAVSTADVLIGFWLTRTRFAGQQSITDRLSFLSVAIEGTTLIIIDAVLIFRCWTVYGRSWRVICLPLVLWACTVACAVTWTVCNAVGVELINSPTAVAIGVGVFYACNFATNVYATCAIVYRLMRVARANSSRSSIIYRICRTVAATGSLYTLTSLPLVVTAFFMPNNMTPYLICDAINFSTAGITFNLLLIRVGQIRA
ncbi:hypothetical protein M378DRAFT_30006, partial [Amanita muscaria Koide BX008]